MANIYVFATIQPLAKKIKMLVDLMNQAYKNKLKNTFLNTKVHSECLYKTIVNELFLVI